MTASDIARETSITLADRATRLFGQLPWCNLSVKGRARHDECDATKAKISAARKAVSLEDRCGAEMVKIAEGRLLVSAGSNVRAGSRRTLRTD